MICIFLSKCDGVFLPSRRWQYGDSCCSRKGWENARDYNLKQSQAKAKHNNYGLQISINPFYTYIRTYFTKI